MKRRARKTEASTAWKMLPVCAALLWPVSGYAQVTESRLSEWLLAHPPAPDDYPLGLSWRVPAEIPAQNLLRSNLLYHLSEDGRARKLPSETASRLYAWVALLPVTGRVPVAVADARWLQANLARDPVLQSDHNVVMPARPRTVTVITSAGQRCAVAHSAGYKAMDYIRVCESQQAGDWAWIVQPDGKIQRFGVASWNLEAQDEPAPGAWLWAGDWPEKLSEQLATFLATQGIAPDPDSTSDAEVVNDRSGVTLPPPADLSYRDMKVTASDWGSAGLLQSPTARMRPAGDFAVNMTRTTPYTNLNVFVQPFDWLEAGFRYTNVSNQLFGPAIAGNQSYKDKSIDLKFRLMKESAKLPQIAVGLKDISGTGLFSGEYFVASKRVNDFDFSLGIGWGYFGARGNLGNPLGSDTRPTVDTGQGGSFDFRQYFRGRTALFGGVQYQTPWDPLIVKLEYEGNNYQHEPFGNNLKQSSPWNLGLVYQLSDSVDVNFGVERGNTAMLGITLHTSLSKMSVPKLSDPPRVAVAPNRPEQKPDWAATSRDLTQQTNWPVQSITREGNDLRVTFTDAKANYWGDRVDRATSVLHRDAPAEIEGFTFNYSDSSAAPVLEQHVDRDTWVAGQTSAQPPSAQGVAVMDRAPTRPNPDEQLYQGKRPMLDGQLGMDFNYNLGGPDAFVLYQLAATAKGQIRLNDSTWIQGGVQFGVLDNYDKFNYDRPSNLPRVRTYMREYMVTSNFTMPNLQITHTGNLSESNYYSLYGGYLESMYAGVGGEWLYRPFQSSYAVGVDLNVVQQREFSQGFGFIDRNGLPNYRTVTGHATLYWDTGWNDLQATISAGRYLAKDSGITVGLSRVFSNGVKLTGGFTKTNVSAEQFGEGSFDKWITISIPFDAMLTRSGSTVGNFTWRPLTRDGGAMLNRAVTLYDLTTARSDRTIHAEPAPLPDKYVMPADRKEGWTLPKGIDPYVYAPPKVPSSQWLDQQQNYKQRLTEALYKQRFRNIAVEFDRSYRLVVTASNDDIHPLSRAVGRAARTALSNAPADARGIRVVYLQGASPSPAIAYDFIDLPRLQRFFDGEISVAELESSVSVEYLSPFTRREDPFAQLGDVETVSPQRSFTDMLTPDYSIVSRVGTDLSNAADYTVNTNWARAALYGAGVVLASTGADKYVNEYVADHPGNDVLKATKKLGNVAVPLIAVGGAATAALLTDDPRLSRTGFAALEAGGVALAVSTGLNYAVGRARPDANRGRNYFEPFSAPISESSFPSDHTMLVWAIATPFAEEYKAPWLYGVATLTNLSRVISNRHWFSDTVASSVLGYGIGRIFWESSRSQNNKFRIGTSGRSVTMSWDW